MELFPDFKELLVAFADEGVDYMIIGGYAVGLHGQPRYTKDIDLWIADTEENIQCVYGALVRFGAPAHLCEALRASGPDEFVFLGVPPLRVDILKSVPGGAFEKASKNRVKVTWGGITVDVVGFDDLIALKRASGRMRDRRDIKTLMRVRGLQRR